MCVCVCVACSYRFFIAKQKKIIPERTAEWERGWTGGSCNRTQNLKLELTCACVCWGGGGGCVCVCACILFVNFEYACYHFCGIINV